MFSTVVRSGSDNMKAESGRFSLKVLKLIYSSLGIFLNPTSQKYYTALVFAVFLSLVPLTLYCVMVSLVVVKNSIAFRANTAALILFLVIYTLLVLCTQMDQARWILFYETVQTLLIDQSLNDEFEALLKADIKQLIYFLGIASSVILIFPALNICTAGVELGSYETLVLPTAYPWPANTPLWYTITSIFQCCSISIQFFCIVGNISFLYYFRALITSLNAALERKIAQLITSSGKETKKQRDDEGINGLRDVIRNHRDLTRFGNQYKRMMAPCTHLSIINVFISGVFIVSSMLWAEDNVLLRLKLLDLHTCISYMLFFFCSVGQIFDEMNTQVMGHIYDINWFEKSIAFRKEMIMFMTFLQKPQPVKVFKVKVLNWVFVATMVRVTYSVLQVFIRMMQH